MNRVQPNRKKKRKTVLKWIKVGVILALIYGISEGVGVLWSRVYSSPYLKIHHIELDGLNHLTEEHVMALLESCRNQSLLRVNLGEYRRRLEDDPWIRTAYLKRHFPDQVVVKIQEKIPMAYVREGAEFFLLDEEGRYISKEKATQAGLPEIKGLHLAKWIGGDEKELRMAQRGVVFIESIMKPNFLFAKEDLTSVTLQTEDDLEATIGGASFLFRFPYPAQQWVRFLSVKNDILTRNPLIEKIDLRYSGKVIVVPIKEKA